MKDNPTPDGEVTRTTLGTWGSLHLVEEVGRGGFGTVYRAWEPVLAREVALKVIRPREAGAEAIAELLREGQLLARVRHTHVVTIYGAQQQGDEIGLWMEFVNGRSLSDLVALEGPRAANEATLIGISLCQALAAVHRAGVIHRDIKAQNVMRESGGRIVLMDFGAGQVLKRPGGHREYAVGTPPYMAPEVLLGSPASVASDVYSLGVLLYFLVTGAYPVAGQTWSDFLSAHSRGARRPLGDVRPDISADYVRIVERATALNPVERFQTAGALLTALSETASGLVAAQPEQPDPVRPARDNRPQGITIDRRLVMALVVAAGILILGAVTSGAFNHTLGRTGEFGSESLVSMWIWGLRALVPGMVYSAIGLLVWSGLRAFLHVLRNVPAVKELSATTTIRRSSLAWQRWGEDLPSLAQTMLVLQVVAIAAFCWYFSGILAGITTFVEDASAADLEPLRPEYRTQHGMYALVMSVLILAMSLGAYQIRTTHRLRGVALPAVFRANLAAIAIALVVLVLPWRLLWQNRFEVAFHQDERCYILGEATTALLLYCPSVDGPKTKRIPAPDVDLKRTGQTEYIYTRPPIQTK